MKSILHNLHLRRARSLTLRAVSFQLAVRAGVAVRAAVFPLAVRAGRARRALAFQLAMSTTVALHAPHLHLPVMTVFRFSHRTLS